jgi:hypothetical protein
MNFIPKKIKKKVFFSGAYNRIKYDMTRVFVAMVYGTGTKREKKRKVEKSPVERDLSLMVSSDLKWTIQEEKATKSAKAFAQIESSYPTMTDEYETYRLVELDDNGRVRRVLGYFKAVSENHARIRAAVIKNNKEIFLTGYYRANTGNNIGEEIQSKIKMIEDSMKKLQKELDELNNPL